MRLWASIKTTRPRFPFATRVSRLRGPSYLRALGGRAPAALKAASRGPALRRHASTDALLLAPPFPCLRPPMARIYLGPRSRDTPKCYEHPVTIKLRGV